MHISQKHAKVTTLKSAVVSATTSQQQQGTTRASTAAHVASHAGPFEQAAIGGRYEGLRGGKVPPTPPNCVRSPVGAPAKAPEEAHHQIPTVSGLKTRRGCGQPTRGRRAPPRAGRFLPPAPGRGSPAAQAPQGSQSRRVFFLLLLLRVGERAAGGLPRARGRPARAAAERPRRGARVGAFGALEAELGARGACSWLGGAEGAAHACCTSTARAWKQDVPVRAGARVPVSAVSVCTKARGRRRRQWPLASLGRKRAHAHREAILQRASSAVVVRALPEVPAARPTAAGGAKEGLTRGPRPPTGPKRHQGSLGEVGGLAESRVLSRQRDDM